MQVTIRLKRDSYTVDAIFHLINTGETATEMVGVPKYGVQNMPDADSDVKSPIYDFVRFDAWVHNRKTEFKEVRHFLKDPNAPPIGGYPFAGLAERPEVRWMVKDVTFPRRSVTPVRVRYEALYHYFVIPTPYEVGRYYCSTAQYWKGTIRKATFTIDSTDIGEPRGIAWGMSPAPRAITTHMQKYEMREYEPPTWKPFEFGGAD
jgi:hypothetical protein